MEKTYEMEVETLDGDKKTITMKHLTARDATRMVDDPALLGLEPLIEMVSPGTLDFVSPAFIIPMVQMIEEKDKSFFDQVAKMAATQAKKKKKSSTSTRKPKKNDSEAK